MESKQAKQTKKMIPTHRYRKQLPEVGQMSEIGKGD